MLLWILTWKSCGRKIQCLVWSTLNANLLCSGSDYAYEKLHSWQFQHSPLFGEGKLTFKHYIFNESLSEEQGLSSTRCFKRDVTSDSIVIDWSCCLLLRMPYMVHKATLLVDYWHNKGRKSPVLVRVGDQPTWTKRWEEPKWDLCRSICPMIFHWGCSTSYLAVNIGFIAGCYIYCNTQLRAASFWRSQMQ